MANQWQSGFLRDDTSGALVVSGSAQGGSATPTKRVTLAISGDASTTTGVTDFLQRFYLQLPVDTTRWRLRIRNAETNGAGSGSATVHTGAFALTSLYIGAPVIASGVWNGNMASCTSVLSGLTPPTDGSDYSTPWVTGAASQFAAYTPLVLSLGTTHAGITLASGNGSQLFYFGEAGCAADAGTATLTVGGSRYLSYNIGALDIRLEYEAVTERPVVLCLGDSLTAGYLGHGTPNTPGPMATWPAQAAQRGGFLWINAGRGGAVLATFDRTTATALARFDLATTVPDVLIIGAGGNDAGQVASLASYQANMALIIATARTIGIKKILVGTPMLRDLYGLPGILMESAASGATTLKTSVAYANGDVIDIDYLHPTRAEQRTVSGASSGTYPPYTTTVSVATGQIHDIYATTGTAYESRRRDYAEWIRNGVPGASGVVDFSWALGNPNNRNSPAMEFFGGETLHPTPQFAIRAAEVACMAVVA